MDAQGSAKRSLPCLTAPYLKSTAGIPKLGDVILLLGCDGGTDGSTVGRAKGATELSRIFLQE